MISDVCFGSKSPANTRDLRGGVPQSRRSSAIREIRISARNGHFSRDSLSNETACALVEVDSTIDDDALPSDCRSLAEIYDLSGNIVN